MFNEPFQFYQCEMLNTRLNFIVSDDLMILRILECCYVNKLIIFALRVDELL